MTDDSNKSVDDASQRVSIIVLDEEVYKVMSQCTKRDEVFNALLSVYIQSNQVQQDVKLAALLRKNAKFMTTLAYVLLVFTIINIFFVLPPVVWVFSFICAVVARGAAGIGNWFVTRLMSALLAQLPMNQRSSS